jgi:hypothetical protein
MTWPTQASATLVGLVVTTGGEHVVSVAALVVAVPQALVKTARYWLPFCDEFVAKVNVVLVAPGILLNDAPPLVLTCHCTVGVGLPPAAAVKVALPLMTVCEAGLVVTTGVVLTVSVALLVTDPQPPVTVTATL